MKDAWSDAFNLRERGRFTELHSESVVFYDPTLPQPIRGRANLGKWFDGLLEMFPDCRVEIGRVYGLGDWDCAECVESGTMRGRIRHQKGEVPATGKSFKMNLVIVCRVEGGRISEVRGFYDVFDLMSQLGLQP